MNVLLSQIENHSVLVTIILFVFSIIGFLIKHFFFKKEERNSTSFIKADGDISAEGDIIVGDTTIHNTTKVNPCPEPKNIVLFGEYIDKSSWREEVIDHKEVWVCEDDNTFQIEYAPSVLVGEQLTESWMQEFPQSYGSKFKVHLLIDRTKIKELIFVSTDGGRIFVPLPSLDGGENGRPKYFWERSSLEYRIGKIIGDFYRYNSLEEVARVSNIEIR